MNGREAESIQVVSGKARKKEIYDGWVICTALVWLGTGTSGRLLALS
jgi:hypothetical protein